MADTLRENLVNYLTDVYSIERRRPPYAAAMISAAQRVEHYEIAVYGALRDYARCSFTDQTRLLDETLDEQSADDEKLAELATSGINVEARTAVATVH